VPRTKTIDLIGGSTSSQTLGQDVTGLGLDDIRAMIINITQREVAEQIAAGNDPDITDVDGSKARRISDVNKKVVVLFGVMLPVAALGLLVQELLEAIKSTTTARTGALSSASSWEWSLIRSGRKIAIPADGSISFGPRDFLVLKPRLWYASAANKRVAAGFKSLTYKATAKGRASKRNQGLGFMAYTARRARQLAEFAAFSVTVGSTTQFAVPGEVRKYGTQYLLVAPRRRGAFRR
jgi:hypothetical protein